jgi:hypothetical protein
MIPMIQININRGDAQPAEIAVQRGGGGGQPSIIPPQQGEGGQYRPGLLALPLAFFTFYFSAAAAAFGGTGTFPV